MKQFHSAVIACLFAAFLAFACESDLNTAFSGDDEQGPVLSDGDSEGIQADYEGEADIGEDDCGEKDTTDSDGSEQADGDNAEYEYAEGDGADVNEPDGDQSESDPSDGDQDSGGTDYPDSDPDLPDSDPDVADPDPDIEAEQEEDVEVSCENCGSFTGLYCVAWLEGSGCGYLENLDQLVIMVAENPDEWCGFVVTELAQFGLIGEVVGCEFTGYPVMDGLCIVSSDPLAGTFTVNCLGLCNVIFDRNSCQTDGDAGEDDQAETDVADPEPAEIDCSNCDEFAGDYCVESMVGANCGALGDPAGISAAVTENPERECGFIIEASSDFGVETVEIDGCEFSETEIMGICTASSDPVEGTFTVACPGICDIVLSQSACAETDGDAGEGDQSEEDGAEAELVEIDCSDCDDFAGDYCFESAVGMGCSYMGDLSGLVISVTEDPSVYCGFIFEDQDGGVFPLTGCNFQNLPAADGFCMLSSNPDAVIISLSCGGICDITLGKSACAGRKRAWQW